MSAQREDDDLAEMSGKTIKQQIVDALLDAGADGLAMRDIAGALGVTSKRVSTDLPGLCRAGVVIKGEGFPALYTAGPNARTEAPTPTPAPPEAPAPEAREPGNAAPRQWAATTANGYPETLPRKRDLSDHPEAAPDWADAEFAPPASPFGPLTPALEQALADTANRLDIKLQNRDQAIAVLARLEEILDPSISHVLSDIRWFLTPLTATEETP